ncbi:uncharacterized protein TRAVEDRAFT_43406 [Trametes versicolor FP-101664 SS1]|uniref:uncharacterized protein n=1 Tax=Trametes versicolor (strain FP-101664) TaxID=717944 RepID=UPI0004623099|nr:uncharacterized protein TRAVEDRAFT_43406 [Trametes versicolor FP-101664 SS1]EIW63099.1 hypothetical protein TRAVEDRAFT_43406 [Trametes versicolor FP-101664 SS1]
MGGGSARPTTTVPPPIPTIDAARTADTVSAGIPPELFTPLQEFFACAIIGFPIATTIYGITVLQTYLYFRRYPKDSAALKSLVSALWALDTLTIALISHAIYNLFVLNLGHLADDVKLPWSVVLEVAITDVIIVAVQCYFAHQLYKPSCGNKILTGSIVLLTIPTIFIGIFTLVETFRNTSAGLRLLPASSPLVLTLGGVQAALALLCDMLITGGLCVHFRGARVACGRARTNALVDKLMVYAIQRGALTTVIQGVSLVTLSRAALADATVAATTMATTLRFRDAPSANSESSGNASFVLGWEDAQRSRLTAPRILVPRSSTGTLASGGEVKTREHVEDAA